MMKEVLTRFMEKNKDSEVRGQESGIRVLFVIPAQPCLEDLAGISGKNH